MLADLSIDEGSNTARMKMLVFAHTPPPFHGQSYMVQLMVEGFASARGDVFGVRCYHVNARVSEDLADVGTFRPGKLGAALLYCAEAIRLRFLHGPRTLYYVPAPPKRSAVYRDWVVLALCRPFFAYLVLHWHAAGLADWLEQEAAPWERWLTRRALGSPALSVVCAKVNAADAQAFASRRTVVLPNGIPDPCADFADTILPRRISRLAARAAALQQPSTSESRAGDAPQEFRVLFMALCVEEKGVFASLEAAAAVNRRLMSSATPLRLTLIVAGVFPDAQERARFDARSAQLRDELQVMYVGFATGPEKHRLLAESDCLCFPTYYRNEAQPLNIIEAMAFGMPVVTTRWRGIPELLPDDYEFIVEPRDSAALTERLLAAATTGRGEFLRERYLQQFTTSRHLAALASALRSVDDS